MSNNRNGQPDTVQTNDDILFLVSNFFIQGDWIIKEKWFFNTGISLNRSSVEFSRLSQYPVSNQKRIYRNELAFRIYFLFITEYRSAAGGGFEPSFIITDGCILHLVKSSIQCCLIAPVFTEAVLVGESSGQVLLEYCSFCINRRRESTGSRPGSPWIIIEFGLGECPGCLVIEIRVQERGG